MGKPTLYETYTEQLTHSYAQAQRKQNEWLSAYERDWLNQMDERTRVLPDATLQALYPNITLFGPNGDKVYNFISDHALYIAYLGESENTEEARKQAIKAFVMETLTLRSVMNVWNYSIVEHLRCVEDIKKYTDNLDNLDSIPTPTGFPLGLSLRIGAMCELSDNIAGAATNKNNYLYSIIGGCCWVLNHQVYDFPFLVVADEYVERVNEFAERVSTLAAPAREALNRT